MRRVFLRILMMSGTVVLGTWLSVTLMSENEAFWLYLVFFLTVGNLVFSPDIETYYNNLRVLRTSYGEYQYGKFEKLEKASEKRRNELKRKIKRAIWHINYDIYLAAITLVHSFGENKNLSYMESAVITFLIILVLILTPYVLVFIVSKLSRK